MNQQMLKVGRAVIAVVVLIILFVTVRGWWTDYQAVERTPSASVESTASAGGDADGSKTEAKAAEGILVVEIDGLNLRNQPAIDGEKIRALDKGDKLTLVKTQGDWYFVVTGDDEEGWISANKSYTELQKPKKKK